MQDYLLFIMYKVYIFLKLGHVETHPVCLFIVVCFLARCSPIFIRSTVKYTYVKCNLKSLTHMLLILLIYC